MKDITPKKHPLARRLLLWLAALLILAGAGCFVYVNDYYRVTDREGALACPDNVALSEVAQGGTSGWFFDGPGTDTALIFYPGAKVDPLAYTGILKQLAAGGIDCYLVAMPGNLAILGSSKADALINTGSYQHWLMAGHSLGGAMAAMYTANHTDTVEGLVFLAAYSTKDLAQSGVSVLSVYGSEDGVLNRQKLEDGRLLMPADYQELVLSGGNHAGFGDYGPQKGDGTAALPADEQKDLTAQAILDWYFKK